MPRRHKKREEEEAFKKILIETQLINQNMITPKPQIKTKKQN